MDGESNKFLAWFLGPKAEHAQLLEDSLLLVLRDYIHWRRNYFPGDKVLVSRNMQNTLDDEYDALSQNVIEMTAELRRNFPFYSPRYIAHQLSDTTLPAMIGYLAGMLYNPNNVTPEAAPVTVDWEIEACNEVLAMLGYTPPPAPPSTGKDIDKYHQRMRREFGWAHITLGGTTANLEALWIARSVRYFPLSVRDVAIQEDLAVEVRLPAKRSNGTPIVRDIRQLSDWEALLLRPNESVYLLAKYVETVRKKFDFDKEEREKASKKAWELLNASKYGPGKGVGSAFHKYPPVVFVSGAAHYSVSKAADVLGIGKDSVVSVAMDSDFRMDVKDLERRIRQALHEGRIPLAVIAIAGTTEEGAVDPVHELIDLRRQLEAEEPSVSFWLHIDAAWGGFVRSLFREADAVLAKIARKFGINYADVGRDWHGLLFSRLRAALTDAQTKMERELADHEANISQFAAANDSDSYVAGLRAFLAPDWERTLGFVEEDFKPDPGGNTVLAKIARKFGLDNPSDVRNLHDQLFSRLRKVVADKGTGKLTSLNDLETQIGQFVMTNDLDSCVEALRTFFVKRWKGTLGFVEADFKASLWDRIELVSAFVQDEIDLSWGKYRKTTRIVWGTAKVCSAFVAFDEADSITVDPHKLGYLPYPCGVVAFKNDRVRHFVLQQAPYITSASQNVLVHMPPKHLSLRHIDTIPSPDQEPRVMIEAFAPFVLEGSKPGASAAALRLAIRTIPLTMHCHGAILRASILAARELYEWINTWQNSVRDNKDVDYELIPLLAHVPDINIMTFVVKRRNSSSLADMNRMTKSVYDHFTIQAELGERQYSYAQPFFLSKTSCEEPKYRYNTLSMFFERCQLRDAARGYSTEGLVVLRATVMNPYIYPMRKLGVQNLVKEFMSEIDRAASKASQA